MNIAGGSRRVGVGMLPALMLAFVTSPAWTLELAAVLENTTVSPPARVSFREERHNRMLKEALVLTGYLEYLEEGRLRKVVETPFNESFLVDGDSIEVLRNGEVRKIALGRNKALGVMLDGIEAILTGRIEQLNALFRFTLSGTSDDWALQLTPRSRQVSSHLRSLRVVGDASSVTSIRFDLNEDEWHLLEILPHEPER